MDDIFSFIPLFVYTSSKEQATKTINRHTDKQQTKPKQCKVVILIFNFFLFFFSPTRSVKLESNETKEMTSRYNG